MALVFLLETMQAKTQWGDTVKDEPGNLFHM